MASPFKAYDIRGIYPEEINEELAYKVGRALVRFLFCQSAGRQLQTIVVGRDVRLSSPALREKLIEGISCEGADVVDIGICTTPMLNFAVANYGYDGGVMISASHNPGNYNAFKLIKSEAQQIDEDSGIKEIKNLVEKGFAECGIKGALTEKDVLNDYISHILEFSQDISHLKVVVDYGNGVGSVSGKPTFARLDVSITELYDNPDGNFPNHPANPHDIENFNDIKKAVLKEKADIGIFFDGDADRAWFVDDLGRVVPNDLLTILLARDLLGENPKANVYFDLRFSKVVPEQIKKMGGTPVMMRVGNPFYKKALKEKGGILAAEFAGHFMFPENFNIDDGLFAAIKVISLISKNDKKISKMIDALDKYETSNEESLEAKNPETLYDRIISAFPEGKFIELDGVYLDMPGGFVSVRQSQNEPHLFRIRVEAKTEKELNERLHKVNKIVRGD